MDAKGGFAVMLPFWLEGVEGGVQGKIFCERKNTKLLPTVFY